jgi:hypothetical protein
MSDLGEYSGAQQLSSRGLAESYVLVDIKQISQSVGENSGMERVPAMTSIENYTLIDVKHITQNVYVAGQDFTISKPSGGSGSGAKYFWG